MTRKKKQIEKLTYWVVKWRSLTDYQKRHFGEYWTGDFGIPLIFRQRDIASTFRDHDKSILDEQRKDLVTMKITIKEVRRKNHGS